MASSAPGVGALFLLVRHAVARAARSPEDPRAWVWRCLDFARLKGLAIVAPARLDDLDESVWKAFRPGKKRTARSDRRVVAK
jgi:hypothetical protein